MNALKKEWPLTLLAIAFLIWAGALLTTPVRPTASELTWVKFVEVTIGLAAAAGTAAAALVALYLGLESQRKHDLQDRQRMLLTAAGCHPRVKALGDFLGSFAASMVFGGGPNAAPDQIHQLLTVLFGHLDQLDHRCSDEELLRLAPLQNNVAGRLAKLQAELKMVRSDLARIANWGGIDKDYRFWLAQRWRTIVLDAASSVTLLAEELRVAAAEGVAFVESKPEWTDDDDWQ